MADGPAEPVAHGDGLEAELLDLLATARAQQALIRSSLTTLAEYLHRNPPT